MNGNLCFNSGNMNVPFQNDSRYHIFPKMYILIYVSFRKITQNIRWSTAGHGWISHVIVIHILSIHYQSFLPHASRDLWSPVNNKFWNGKHFKVPLKLRFFFFLLWDTSAMAVAAWHTRPGWRKLSSTWYTSSVSFITWSEHWVLQLVSFLFRNPDKNWKTLGRTIIFLSSYPEKQTLSQFTLQGFEYSYFIVELPCIKLQKLWAFQEQVLENVAT